jgi:prolipoprotein diacylglyceryltransferase
MERDLGRITDALDRLWRLPGHAPEFQLTRRRMLLVHSVFDLLAVLGALGMAHWFRAQYGLTQPPGITGEAQRHAYLAVLLIGLALGAFLFGTWNLRLVGQPGLGKSVAGGLAGAVLAAELFKHYHGIRTSTGLYFVPGLLVLIAIGRLGCFFSGIEDFTYGTPTDLPWGVDFGDGVARHPVQLYEALSMVLFLGYLLSDYPHRPKAWQRQGFYAFVLFYAAQRFVWEFLKPYPAVALRLNLFQWLCLVLAIYGIWKAYRSTADEE